MPPRARDGAFLWAGLFGSLLVGECVGVTPVDAHGEHMRFTWELGPAGEAALVVGTDFATVSADGRLKGMTGFIDRAPAGLAG